MQAAKIAVLSVAFLVSVVLGNVALKFIPVSFSQVHAKRCDLERHWLLQWHEGVSP